MAGERHMPFPGHWLFLGDSAAANYACYEAAELQVALFVRCGRRLPVWLTVINLADLFGYGGIAKSNQRAIYFKFNEGMADSSERLPGSANSTLGSFRTGN